MPGQTWVQILLWKMQWGKIEVAETRISLERRKIVSRVDEATKRILADAGS